MIGYGWRDGGLGWGAWLLMALMMLLVVAAVIGVAIVLARSRTDRQTTATPPAGGGRDGALRLLDERFARGEIDAEEYTHRRDLLRS